MKLVGEIKDATTTQAALARYLKLSKPRINQLINEGVVIRADKSGGIYLAESIKNCYAQRSEKEENTLNEEKRLHEKAKRELAELKLAKARGEVCKVEVVEKALIEMLNHIRTNLYSVIPQISSVAVNSTEEKVNENLTVIIENILEELSNFDASTLSSEEE